MRVAASDGACSVLLGAIYAFVVVLIASLTSVNAHQEPFYNLGKLLCSTTGQDQDVSWRSTTAGQITVAPLGNVS